MPLERATQAIVLELEAQRARNGALVSRCEDLAAQVFQLRDRLSAAQAQTADVIASRGDLESQLAQTRARLADVEAQLDHARAVVRLMETSRFWRARLVWVRLRRLLASRSRWRWPGARRGAEPAPD